MSKYSVVITILNEAKTIERLLTSLLEQSLQPDEIVIVDAGSVDETTEIIKRQAKSSMVKIALVEKAGCNRSMGRNMGVVAAGNERIAVTDAGCVANKDWLEQIDKCFSKGVEAVAGFYRMSGTLHKQRLFSWFLGVLPETFDKMTYLPSSRSVAFTKKAFSKIGGYPEKLNYCEDLIFAQNLKNKTNMVVCERALVEWDMPDGYATFGRMMMNYAAGDVEARYWRHLWRIVTVFFRYGVFILFPWSILLYPLFVWGKFHGRKINQSEWWQVLVVQVVSDVGVAIGTMIGVRKLLILLIF